jgi:glycosyltransferase involved in cell wall biosynthesis
MTSSERTIPSLASVPSISIFTPSNNAELLKQAYASLVGQTDQNFDWFILLNGQALVDPDISFAKDDPRVKVFYSTRTEGFVGALKNEICSHCTGDILLELDHDDLLSPTAVAEVRKAFLENPDVGFVYSNAIYATNDLKPVPRFGNGYGWEWKQHKLEEHYLDEVISPPPAATSVARIWYAPDHLRAFRRELYNLVGGHKKDMRVLDDQDLMSRLFQKTKFLHINKPLYIYRISGNNTWQTNNKEIQDNVMRIYDIYAEKMMMHEAWNAKLRLVELGGRMNSTPNFTTVDLKGADINCDLNQEIPFEDSSVGVLRAIDVLEHLNDPIQIMKEAFRVLAPGGYFIIQVPSTDGRGAFQDPTHKSFWNENSFFYYTDKRWARFIDTPVRFQATRLFTTEKDSNGVCWVRAHLVSLKDGFRPPGEIKI